MKFSDEWYETEMAPDLNLKHVYTHWQLKLISCIRTLSESCGQLDNIDDYIDEL